jgi:AcrR family transcriptional regulator
MSDARGRSGTSSRSPAARPTDDELLDAARAVFAEKGLKSATMDAIAERANSTKPTLYAHFGDKMALYRATVAREAVALRRWLVTAYESSSEAALDQRIRTYVTAMFTYATSQPDSFRMLFDSGDEANVPEHRNLIDVMVQRVAEHIRRYLVRIGRPDGPSVELLAEMMVGLVGRAVGRTLRDEDLDPVAAADLVVSFMSSALRYVDRDAIAAVDGGVAR